MFLSLALIFLVGLSLAAVCERIHLPRIIGLLATGIILGPYVLDLIAPSVLGISSELRQIALMIILIKAGLSLNIAELKRVGRAAVLMSFVPASFEILGYVLFAPALLGITRADAAVMGAVLGAVSPAVVVPRMIKTAEEKYGTKKGIPQLITAGASCDDIFVIVLFTSFADMAQGEQTSFSEFANIPVSIILGVSVGAVCGLLLFFIFETEHKHGHTVRNSVKVIVILGVAFLLSATETLIKDYVAFSGLLAIVAVACVLNIKCPKTVSLRLSDKFGKLWTAAEVALFVLVGAAVDIRYTFKEGFSAVAMIFIALIFRSVGVYICLIKTPLNIKERFFCIISYLPKATVQAAIGSVPLAMGLSCGKAILSVAVLAILITAPLGAFGIDISYKKLLSRDQVE